MSGITIESLGLTKEEIQERVIEQCCDSILRGGRDLDGMQEGLRLEVESRIEEAITGLGEQHIMPGITKYLEEMRFSETNRYGEKKEGTDKTLLEYLTERADAFITEPVSSQGKTKKEDSYNWSANQTRIAHMIHQHLQYSISTAVKKALADFNNEVAKGLADTVKIQLAKTLKNLKVGVTG